MEKKHILLAEDDKNLGFVVQDNLITNGFKVSLCENGEEALKVFANEKVDMCVLDVMMPKRDGFEVAETIKSVNPSMPIIFLTAKSMQEDKIQGLTIGADDYITKPFDFEEFILRVNAVLKRNVNAVEQADEIDEYKIGTYTFEVKNLMLKHSEGNKKLTKKETKILQFLCDHINDIAPRETMLKHIWGNDDYFSGRSMDVFISKLRKYLAFDENIQISNIHGVGFKLEVKS